MSSLFLSWLSRLSLKKPPKLRHLGGVRFLSETPLCHIFGAEHCGSTSRDGDIGKLVIMNITDTFAGRIVLEKTVPMDLMKETGTIGASHGWVATLKDGVVRLQDDLIPSASDSNPKRISLPPLVTLSHCQTQVVTNVAMSSSSPEDDDCIVAVKFLGPQLSLCRPGLKDKSEWVNINIQDPGFFSSRVMYSKRDKMFSMPNSEGTHIRSWDLETHIPHNLCFSSYKEFVQSEWERLSKCRRNEYLVESPTGETFLVKWYTRCYEKTGRAFTERFLVFNIIENRVAIYTKDIGDLCMFLSHKGEPFCLQTSLYGLSPNFIYYLGTHDYGKFGVFQDGTLILHEDKDHGGYIPYTAPYFIPPRS